MKLRRDPAFDDLGLRRGSLKISGLTYLSAVSASALAAGFEAFSHRWWAVLIAPVPLWLVFIASPWLSRLWPRRRVEASARIFRPEPCRGLVVLVSPGKGSETAAGAIAYHGRFGNLSRVWLLHSDTSEEVARKLSEELSRRPELSSESFRLLHLPDSQFDNPGLVHDLIEKAVFQELPGGMTEADVIVDLTGGMKGTSAGAFLAGLPRGRRLEYVSPATRDPRGRGTRPGEPLEIGIDYKLKRLPRR